jgi:hypothetical protein
MQGVLRYNPALSADPRFPRNFMTFKAPDSLSKPLAHHLASV